MTMQFGIMNRGQYNWGDDMATRFQELMAQARHAEKLGFDSFMKGSHFTSKPLHDFNQIAYLGRVMVECPSLRLIAGIVLMPLHKPLDIAELRTRPAGVEIVLHDRRILFVSTEFARKIGKAAEGEVDDTAKRERAAIEKRARETGEIDDGEPVDEDADAIAEIEAQMKANKGRNL